MRIARGLRLFAALAISVLGVYSAQADAPTGTPNAPPPTPPAATPNIAGNPSPPDGAGVGEWRAFARRRRAAAEAARLEAAEAEGAAARSARERTEWERKFEEAREDPVMLMSEREVRQSRLAKLEEERRALDRRLAVLEALSESAARAPVDAIGAGRTPRGERSPADAGGPLSDSRVSEAGALDIDAATTDDDALCRDVDLGRLVTRRDYETARREQVAVSRRVGELRDQLSRLGFAGGDPSGRAALLGDVWCEAAWTFSADLLRLAEPAAGALRRAPLPTDRREAFGRAYDALAGLMSEAAAAPPSVRRSRLADAAVLARDAARKAEALRNAAPLSLPAARNVSEAIETAASALERAAGLVAASADVRRRTPWRFPMAYAADAASLAATFDPYAGRSAQLFSLRQRRDLFAEAQRAFARLSLVFHVDDGAREFIAAELREAERRLARVQRTIALYRAAHPAAVREQR